MNKPTPAAKREDYRVITVRVPPALHAWVKTKAGQEYVSMNTHIIKVLEKERNNEQ